MHFQQFFNLCVICLQMSYADIFTAVADIEELLDSHKQLIDDLDPYVDMQQKKLFIMKGYLDLYSREHIRAMTDIPNYLGNPINAFILIKRLVSDLNYINRVARKGSEYVLNIIVDNERNIYPDQYDLIGAAEALGRLQKTYNLDVRDFANGNLNNLAYSSPMTASDCYDLSQALMVESNYLEAGRASMEEALRKYSQENISYPFTKVDIMNYISHANHILESTENDAKYEDEEDEEESVNTDEDSSLEEESEEETMDMVTTQEFAKYEALCRGEFVLSIKVSSGLTCRYMTENHPFLKLAPFKVEILYPSPEILLFYDVLTDSEMEDIKKMGRPMLKRAEAVDGATNKNTVVSYRISKLAWLYDEESDFIARISQRVSDMTGLSIENAEPVQLCNYGIGGHYEPHFDFSTKLKNCSTVDDERIATTLIYMSDVEQGGATVFPSLGLTCYPKKGTAIFWYNLHPSGVGDLATRHAACPVLQGDKWVATKWIHQYGQEFLRPCNLKYQTGASNKNPYPVPKSVSQEHVH